MGFHHLTGRYKYKLNALAPIITIPQVASTGFVVVKNNPEFHVTACSDSTLTDYILFTGAVGHRTGGTTVCSDSTLTARTDYILVQSDRTGGTTVCVLVYSASHWGIIYPTKKNHDLL